MENKEGFWRGVLVSFAGFCMMDVMMSAMAFLPGIDGLGFGYGLIAINMFIFLPLLVVFGFVAKKKGIGVVQGWLVAIAVLCISIVLFGARKR